MTEVDIAPAAGWYPDPEARAATRFWDGTAWTEHVKGSPARFAPPMAGAVRSAAPAPGASYATVLPRLGQRTNRMATAGLTLGILSLVADVLLIPTVLGIVFSVVGIARAPGRGGVGQVKGVVGIVLSCSGVVAAGVQLAILIPIVVGLQHAAVVGAVKADLADHAASEGVTIASVRCQPGASLSRPGHFVCLATRATGARDIITVTVDAGGGRTWSSPTLN